MQPKKKIGGHTSEISARFSHRRESYFVININYIFIYISLPEYLYACVTHMPDEFGEVASEVVALCRSRISKTGENAITVRYVACKRGGTATVIYPYYTDTPSGCAKNIYMYISLHTLATRVIRVIREQLPRPVSSASFRASFAIG